MQFKIPCFHILNQTILYSNVIIFYTLYICIIKCYYKYVFTITNNFERIDIQIRAQFTT